jgi:NADP-dependent 3-hydroxy acid dehydrogenase YdfG
MDIDETERFVSRNRRNRMETSGTRVWFVTGASRGLGHAFTEAALAAGDRVAGAARDVSPLDDLAAQHPDRLLALPLDVTDRAAVFDVVDRAVEHFGRLDVVVNNAGALYIGEIETDNAEDNAHMLAVNQRLGFREHRRAHEYQLDLPARTRTPAT